VRVGEEAALAALYPKLGDALKARYAGWRCYFLTADLRLARLIGLKASRRIPLYNGPLECRLFEFRIVAGSMRRERTAAAP
jgi:putative N6-adenine-specific DNA methylase